MLELKGMTELNEEELMEVEGGKSIFKWNHKDWGNALKTGGTVIAGIGALSGNPAAVTTGGTLVAGGLAILNR